MYHIILKVYKPFLIKKSRRLLLRIGSLAVVNMYKEIFPYGYNIYVVLAGFTKERKKKEKILASQGEGYLA